MIYNDNLLKLLDIVSHQSLPRDDHDHHIFLCPKTMRNDSTRLKFDELVTFYVNDSNTKQRGPKQLADYKWHWEAVLMSLSQSIFLRKWLVILLDNNSYGAKASKYIKTSGLQVTRLT